MSLKAAGDEDDSETTLLTQSLGVEASLDAPVESVPYFKLFEGSPRITHVLFIIGTTMAFLSGTNFSFMIYLLGQIFDESSDEEEDDYDLYHESRKISICWIVMGASQILVGFISSMCFTRISQEIGRTIRRRYFQAILRKDISYFDIHNAAELPGKMSRDCDLIEGGVGDKFMAFIEVAAFAVWCTILAISKSPQVYLIAMCVVPIILSGNGVFGYGQLIGAGIKEKAYTKAGGVAEESLLEIKTVASFNAQSHISQTYNVALKESIDVMARMGIIKAIGWGLTWGGWMLMGGVVFMPPAKWISDEKKNWIWRDEMEGTDVAVVFWQTLILAIWLGQLAPGIAAFLESKVAGGRAFAFIEDPVSFVDGTQQKQIEGRIEFSKVVFSYPKHPDKEILKGLSFVCEKGKKTAIVGESGAGKSTIIQLLERFYDASNGTISYDGLSIREFDIKFLRKQMGYVSQEPVLFNLTIEENILLGNPSATPEEVETAAKEANALNFIKTLELGLKTHVGMKGSKLSGGQKQRIAIARAMVKKPKVLLLDEATSALDNESEEIVLRAITNIHERRGITMISVAQKLSTIKGADKIVVLSDGMMKEEGTHEELIHKEGLYAAMCAAQGIRIDDIQLEISSRKSDSSTESVVSLSSSKSETISDIQLFKSFPLVRILKSTLVHWPMLLIAFASTIVAGLMYPALSLCVGKIVIYITGPSGELMEHNVRKFCNWLFILSGITFISFSAMGSSLSLMTSRLTKAMRERSFAKMLHLNAEYFDNSNNNSVLLSKNLNRDVELINDAGGPMFGAILIIIVAYISTTIQNFMWQWKLALVMMFVLPIQAFALIRAWVIRLSGVSHPQHQKAATFASDAIMNVKTLTAYHAIEEIETRYERFIEEAFEDTKQERVMNALWYGIGLAFIFWGIAVSFWYGAYLEKFDEADTQDVYIVSVGVVVTVLGIASAALFAPGVPEASRAASRIYQIIDYKPSIDSSEVSGLTPAIQGHLSFSQVSFKYAGRDNMVLQNVGFEIQAGQHIGITGASGSGKTTITQLILRFYDVTEGCIRIDGIDIREYNIQHMRAHIAMVGQEPVLFSGSIRSNVDFGLGKSDEEIKQALVHASIPKFAEDLDREVGTRGNLVSGGQKQRISIARAILRSPKILLLDEATSALDSKTEKKILGALEYAGQGKTVLVIAHRLSTIEKCDKILVMDGGEIKERGTHEELKKREGGIYQKLLSAMKS